MSAAGAVESRGTRPAEEPTPYREYAVNPGTIRFTYGYLIFLTLITLFGLAAARPRVLFAVLLMYLAWRWYEVLRTPSLVRVWQQGQVEFVSRIASLTLDAGTIKLIKRGWRGYWLQHERGAISLYGDIEGFERLLADLRRLNPDLRVVGSRAAGGGGVG